jgi:hypothetical protein
VSAMRGANTGRSNEEGANHPEELRQKTSSTSTEKPHSPHDTRSRSTHSAETSSRGRRPDIHQLCHAQQTTKTTFRDRRPDIPPLTLELQRRTTQAPATQAAQGKLLIDHGRHTNIRGRRPGLKVEQPPLRCVNRVDGLAALRHKTVTQTMQPNALPHETSARHGSRGRRLDVHPPSGAATPASTDPNKEEAMHNRQSSLAGRILGLRLVLQLRKPWLPVPRLTSASAPVPSDDPLKSVSFSSGCFSLAPARCRVFVSLKNHVVGPIDAAGPLLVWEVPGLSWLHRCGGLSWRLINHATAACPNDTNRVFKPVVFLVD